ncbi:MAG: RNA polymerase sigma factor [Bacteroidales bacterium]|nr:RNA polymerase sigma factor [Bacteroidales bacterium]
MNITEYNNCVKLHSDALYRFAMQFVTDTAAAEDTVQDSFVQLWDRHDNVEMEQARSFLFTITRNQLVDQIRHEQVRMRYADEMPSPEGHTTAYRRMEMQDVLRKTLAQLPAIQKEILLLRDWEGFAYKEIAEIAQVSEQQVMTCLFRARVSMRKLLEEEGYSYPSTNKTHRKQKHDEERDN